MALLAKGNQVEKLFASDPLGRARQTIGRVAQVVDLTSCSATAPFAKPVGACQDQAAFLGPGRTLAVTVVGLLPVDRVGDGPRS
jgi:hypothetical protein